MRYVFLLIMMGGGGRVKIFISIFQSLIGSTWIFFDFSFIKYFSLAFKLFYFSFQVGRELMRPNEDQHHSFDTKKLETDNFT